MKDILAALARLDQWAESQGLLTHGPGGSVRINDEEAQALRRAVDRGRAAPDQVDGFRARRAAQQVKPVKSAAKGGA